MDLSLKPRLNRKNVVSSFKNRLCFLEERKEEGVFIRSSTNFRPFPGSLGPLKQLINPYPFIIFTILR
ncbi:hypothetical protein L1887_28366 [Cichorium endivia]|nr:hypothetical protein L1887_28366 [Cichorium endivia]